MRPAFQKPPVGSNGQAVTGPGPEAGFACPPNASRTRIGFCIPVLFGSLASNTVPRLARATIWISLAAAIMLCWGLPAQTAAPVTGLIYYSVENRDAERVEQRGTAGSAGIAFDRLILGSNTRYRIWLLEAATLRVADAEITTGDPGRRFALPDFNFRTASSHDTDGDELSDLGEFILGTNPQVPDTDGDGIRDGAEVRQGTDPLSGRAVRTGVVASADTPGQAKDICAINDLAIVADGTAGVSVFNVFNGMNPVLVTQVDTPGDAVAVACGSGSLIAVADSSAGLAIIDIRDPPASRVDRQVAFGVAARAVAAADNFAFVGLANGQVAVVDMLTGTELSRLPLTTAPLQDLFLAGDYLYALVEGTLYVLAFEGGGLSVVGSVGTPGGVNADNGRMRLFVGGDIAYPVHRNGYNTINVSAPAAPVLIASQNTPQFGWKHVVANGSGLGIAAVSPNQAFDGPHNVSLYDVRDPASNNVFIAEFVTPGVARAVSIYNGLAYVADHLAGLQVINYLAYDALGVPPTISLSTSFASGVAEEGKLMRVTAAVTDDVQVRNVEFYLDGAKVATDGNYPFEHRLVTPLIASGRTSFRLRAKASDTGGNTTWSQELVLNLVPDATPPRVLRALPAAGSILGSVDTAAVYFSEPIVVATLTPATLRLVFAGADNIFGNADDSVVAGGAISYRDNLNAVFLTFSADLPPGSYRIAVGPNVTDLTGNAMSAEFSSTFRVFSLADEDNDGVPDELEPSLGLDPDNSDTDGDGIPDGLEDFDNDGLTNAGEILVGTDPRNPDTNGNGILDGDEDTDGDSLTDGAEVQLGTNPLAADSDGDGWNDEAEVTGNGDPLNPGIRPKLTIAANPLARLGLNGFGATGAFAAGTIVALPQVALGLTSAASPGPNGANTTIAQPPVAIALPAPASAGGLNPNPTVASPPVGIALPAFGTSPAPANSSTVAQPPVRIGFEP